MVTFLENFVFKVPSLFCMLQESMYICAVWVLDHLLAPVNLIRVGFYLTPQGSIC